MRKKNTNDTVHGQTAVIAGKNIANAELKFFQRSCATASRISFILFCRHSSTLHSKPANISLIFPSSKLSLLDKGLNASKFAALYLSFSTRSSISFYLFQRVCVYYHVSVLVCMSLFKNIYVMKGHQMSLPYCFKQNPEP